MEKWPEIRIRRLQSTGMKVVSWKKETPENEPRLLHRWRISAITWIFFHRLSTVRESRKIPGSLVSIIRVVHISSPTANSFLFRFHVLTTSKVRRMGFEPTNCCYIFLDSLVFCLMLIGKYQKKIAREITEVFHPCFWLTWVKVSCCVFCAVYRCLGGCLPSSLGFTQVPSGSSNFHTCVSLQKAESYKRLIPSEPKKWPLYNEIVYPPRGLDEPRRPAVCIYCVLRAEILVTRLCTKSFIVHRAHCVYYSEHDHTHCALYSDWARWPKLVEGGPRVQEIVGSVPSRVKPMMYKIGYL